MAMKHIVTDSVSDSHFRVDPNTRKIIYDTSSGKTKLMQYDHNSERFTFEVPRYIENHDMLRCDVIQVHYVNSSTGTSVSTRRSYRGVHIINDVALESADADVITFTWLVPDTATMFAGPLKFQLKFICHDNEDVNVEGYTWHTDVNSDMTVTAGLEYAESEIDPATTATLQSLEIVEITGGIDVILDGVHHRLYNGEGGSSTSLPEIDVNDNGKVVEVVNGSYSIKYPSASSMMTYIKTLTTTTIDSSSTDDQYPTAKAVYDFGDTYCKLINTLLESIVNGEGTG